MGYHISKCRHQSSAGNILILTKLDGTVVNFFLYFNILKSANTVLCHVTENQDCERTTLDIDTGPLGLIGPIYGLPHIEVPTSKLGCKYFNFDQTFCAVKTNSRTDQLSNTHHQLIALNIVVLTHLHQKTIGGDRM